MMLFTSAIPKYLAGVLLAAAFTSGHAKPDKNAKMSITTPSSHVQLAEPSLGPSPGWWGYRLPAAGGTYRVTARVPRAVCSSVTLSIPTIEGQQGGEYKVRISCVPAP
ncbi:MAG TPA: hypothetical protein VHS26_02250 [Solirubrobacteraceae bacterium]|nr:hypothetical protein [Solirubrobacteraceae bacterium]